MNAHVAHAVDDAIRRLSVSDLRRMIEAGIIDEDENIELIDGELVQMAAKGFAHERVKSALVRLFNRETPEAVFAGIEASLRLDTHVLVEADILICHAAGLPVAREGFIGVPGRDILLLVVVSDTTLRKNRGRKAEFYARYAVPEYWIVDVNERVVWLHRDPVSGRYETIRKIRADEELRPTASELSTITARLAGLS